MEIIIRYEKKEEDLAEKVAHYLAPGYAVRLECTTPPTPKKTMEIIGVDGKVHYRRPEGDPLIAEALAKGLTVREQTS
jgi:hypothetical protein